MQCALAVLSPVARPDLIYFSSLYHMWPDFRTKVIEYKMCFIFTVNLSEIFLILRRTEGGMIKNVYWYSCKVTIILVTF